MVRNPQDRFFCDRAQFNTVRSGQRLISSSLIRVFTVRNLVCGSRKLGDHPQTRGGPTNFTIAKKHILENRGGD